MPMPDLDKPAGVIPDLVVRLRELHEFCWAAENGGPRISDTEHLACEFGAAADEIERLRGLLIPDGFVAVPREPTEAMIEAAIDASPMWASMTDPERTRRFYITEKASISTDDARAIYRAMIQAQTDEALQDGRDG